MSISFQGVISHIFDENWTIAIEAYLDSGGDINYKDELQGWSLMHYAAEHQNIEAIKILAHRGANLNIQDLNGWTPLHLAVDSDIDGANQQNEEIKMTTTKTFLSLGASPLIRNNKNDTPRDIASHYGQNVLEKYDSIILS